jgi:hypothetical protein
MMDWINKVRTFCEFYNIDIEYLVDTLYEPKVIPMIRGKAFEFTMLSMLTMILPEEEFEVSKSPMNAQLGSHDVDVAVYHRPTDVKMSVECKLAGKGKYRYEKNEDKHVLQVKCMRSRTLGDTMLDQQSTKLVLNRALLKVHNDSYLPSDFDVVFTSIGNAFYITNKDGIFEWGPKENGKIFLRNLTQTQKDEDLQDAAFTSMYVAVSHDLAILEDNENKCGRKKCTSKENCGFIPNYPLMVFKGQNRTPEHPWYPLKEAATVFRRVAARKARLR